MSDNNMNGKDFLLGAVVGGLLGAVTALLLAPKSGKDLRMDLSDQYQTVSEKTQKLAGEVSEKTQKLAGEVSEKTQKIATEVSAKSQKLAEEISEKSQELASKAKDVASTVAGEIKNWKEAQKEQLEEAAENIEAEVKK